MCTFTINNILGHVLGYENFEETNYFNLLITQNDFQM